MTNVPKYIIVHCTAVSWRKLRDQFFAVNRYHKERGFPESSLGWNGGYHILVSGGKEYRYREDWEEGAHCNTVVDGLSMNFQSLGLGIGFDGDVEMPYPDDLPLAAARIKKWKEKYGIPNDRVHIGPHRRWTPTKTCYGSLLADDWALELANPQPAPFEKHEKQDAIVAQSKLLDLLRTLLLQLMILLDLQNRQKAPPAPGA